MLFVILLFLIHKIAPSFSFANYLNDPKRAVFSREIQSCVEHTKLSARKWTQMDSNSGLKFEPKKN